MCSSDLVVDDPLPSLFEPLRPEFASRQAETVADLAEDWLSDYREFRQDRALFFRDRLPAGRHQVRYLARVRAAGTAVAPSAKVEQMYRPESFGTTEAGQVTSLPLE